MAACVADALLYGASCETARLAQVLQLVSSSTMVLSDTHTKLPVIVVTNSSDNGTGENHDPGTIPLCVGSIVRVSGCRVTTLADMVPKATVRQANLLGLRVTKLDVLSDGTTGIVGDPVDVMDAVKVQRALLYIRQQQQPPEEEQCTLQEYLQQKVVPLGNLRSIVMARQQPGTEGATEESANSALSFDDVYQAAMAQVDAATSHTEQDEDGEEEIETEPLAAAASAVVQDNETTTAAHDEPQADAAQHDNTHHGLQLVIDAISHHDNPRRVDRMIAEYKQQNDDSDGDDLVGFETQQPTTETNGWNANNKDGDIHDDDTRLESQMSESKRKAAPKQNELPASPPRSDRKRPAERQYASTQSPNTNRRGKQLRRLSQQYERQQQQDQPQTSSEEEEEDEDDDNVGMGISKMLLSQSPQRARASNRLLERQSSKQLTTVMRVNGKDVAKCHSPNHEEVTAEAAMNGATETNESPTDRGHERQQPLDDGDDTEDESLPFALQATESPPRTIDRWFGLMGSGLSSPTHSERPRLQGLFRRNG